MLRHWISKEKILPHIPNMCRFNHNSGAFLQNNYEVIADQIDWIYLSFNPSAVPLLEQHPDKIYWFGICANPSLDTMPLIEQNLDKLDRECWRLLSKHPHAISLLEKHPENIYWAELSLNPAAISLLEQNLNKVEWDLLCENANALDLVEENTDKLKLTEIVRLAGNTNPRAINLLEQHLDVLDLQQNFGYGWFLLSRNPTQAALSLLEKYPEHIVWSALSSNPVAVPLLKRNLDKVDWISLSGNSSPYAVALLECHLDKVYDELFFTNPSVIHLLERRFCEKFPQHNYSALSKNPAIFEDVDYYCK